MFAGLRACDPTEPLGQVAFYRFCRKACAVLAAVLYRLRVAGGENIPPAGERGLLVVANHESHFDPVFLGLGLGKRNMASIARAGLFRFPPLGALLRAVGCISIKQEEGDAGAMRAAIGELKKGRIVLIFPEGSRSLDGAMQEFKRGAWLLVSRSGCDVIPAAVAGTFEAWPRSRSFPHLFGHRCEVAFGMVVSNEELKKLGPDAGLGLLAGRVDELRAGLRAKSQRA